MRAFYCLVSYLLYSLSFVIYLMGPDGPRCIQGGKQLENWLGVYTYLLDGGCMVGGMLASSIELVAFGLDINRMYTYVEHN